MAHTEGKDGLELTAGDEQFVVQVQDLFRESIEQLSDETACQLRVARQHAISVIGTCITSTQDDRQ